MRREERQARAVSRIIGLHDPQVDSPLCANNSSPQMRLEALWDLTLEYLAWAEPNERQLRLQRSVCRLQHRSR